MALLRCFIATMLFIQTDGRKDNLHSNSQTTSPIDKSCPGADPKTCGCEEASKADYRGTLSVTENGDECQDWSAQYPQSHKYTPEAYPDAGLESNYCRNPSGSKSPWCYTINPDKRWGWCNVPECKEAKEKRPFGLKLLKNIHELSSSQTSNPIKNILESTNEINNTILLTEHEVVLMPAPAKSPTPKNFCPYAYNETKTDYVSGSMIEVEGVIFKCRPKPYEEYCNYAQFDPKMLEKNVKAESYWLNAWLRMGPCIGSPSMPPVDMSSMSNQPTEHPSIHPTLVPSESPAEKPSLFPTNFLSNIPVAPSTLFPSEIPSETLNNSPTKTHTLSPTLSLTISPTLVPTLSPTTSPTISSYPSVRPSYLPSTSEAPSSPSNAPTTSTAPTGQPSRYPTMSTSPSTSISPSQRPSMAPSTTTQPSLSPSTSPSTEPSQSPTQIVCGAFQKKIRIELRTDKFPSDTNWEFYDRTKNIVLLQANKNYGRMEMDVRELCINEGEYEYILYDAFGDGLCCINGDGHYSISFRHGDGTWRLVVAGAQFKGKKLHHHLVLRNGEVSLICKPPQRKLTIDILADQYGEDTSWEFRYMDSGMIIAKSERTYGPIESDTRDLCINDATLYEFTVRDAYKDGMCCSYGKGYYRILTNSSGIQETILYGGRFGSEITHLINTTAPHLSERDISWLDSHNVRRKEWHTYYKTDYVPLQWSEALKAEAKIWANTLLDSCGRGMHHDPNTIYGENAAGNTGRGSWAKMRSPEQILTRFVEYEVDDPWPANSHLTQALWRGSKYVGCAESHKLMDRGRECHTQVCRYARSGNCNMGSHQRSNGTVDWLTPMLETFSYCSPACPPDGCRA